jgi:hypothetical protein
MRADLRQRLLQVGDELQERLAHMALVVGLVRVEPGPVVVAVQRAQEGEGVLGEIRFAHIDDACKDVVIPAWSSVGDSRPRGIQLPRTASMRTGCRHSLPA